MAREILVSGASRGLGYCIALLYLKAGESVHIIVRKRTDAVEELVHNYPLCHVYLGDVGSDAAIQDALSKLRENVEVFDLIYNVAGIFWEKDRRGLAYLDIDEMADMMNVNAFGALRILKGLAGQIKEKTRIVNISSESGSLTNCEERGMYSYCMSKAALNMATRQYVREHGDRRNIITVCPGWMRTDMGGAQADLDPMFSAEKIIRLAERMDELEEGKLFFKYDGRALPW